MRYIQLLSYPALLVFMCMQTGCGSSSSATVQGKVTCNEKPVVGSILFSPIGDGSDKPGEIAQGPLDAEGKYKLTVKTVGKYRVVVSPSDVRYPVKPGELAYPCDLSTIEREIKAGQNDLDISLSPPKRK